MEEGRRDELQSDLIGNQKTADFKRGEMESKFDVAFALYVKREMGRYFGAGNVHGLTF